MVRSALCGLIILLLNLQASQAEEVQSELEHKFSGKIELGGDKNTGNTINQTFDGSLELGYAYGDLESTFTFIATEASESGVATESYYEAGLKTIYNLPEEFYAFLKLGYREDTFSGIYWEQSYVLGFGYHLFADPATKYSVDLELGRGERVTKKLVNGLIRSRLDYDPGTHVAILSKYEFSEDDYLSVDLTGEFGNDDDYIEKKYAWVHKLFDALSFDLSYVSRTLTAPGVDLVATDTTTTIKLGYEF